MSANPKKPKPSASFTKDQSRSSSAMSLTRVPRVSYQASATRRSQHRATNLPVSADFENGFGDEPEYVAETIRLAADAGLVGCTIEDAIKDKDNPIYPFEAAVARIEATVAAADALGFAFHLTGRCENFLRGNTDLDDTIRRLKAYEDAGAKVLMAPGLTDLEAVKTVFSALSKLFNSMVGIPGRSFDVASLQASGVLVWRRRSIEAPCKRLSMRRRKPATKAHSDLSKRVCPRRTWPD